MMKPTIFLSLKACDHGNKIISCMRDGNFLSSQVSITSQEGFSCMNWLRHSGSTLRWRQQDPQKHC